MRFLRYGLIALGALGIFALFSSQIKALETIRKDGDIVLLELRPADPRALMMGDFMALRYAQEIPMIDTNDLTNKGSFVLKLDQYKVGEVVSIDKGEPLPNGHVKINYIRQRRGVTFGAPRYYFQNGTADTYEVARYGKFRVNESGRAILVGLVDAGFNDITPPKAQ